MPNTMTLVYYVGGGASAKSLPIVSNTPERMSALADQLGNGECSMRPSEEDTLKQLIEEMQPFGQTGGLQPID